MLDLTWFYRGLGVAVLLLTACTPKAELPIGQRPPKIGFILATTNEERYLKDRQYFIDAAQRAGAQVEFASCDNQVSVQTAKVENLLSKGVDVLVVQPVHSEAAAAIAKSARAEGVPVISYDRLIRNAPVDLYVTQDSFQVGVLQARQALQAMGGKGNVVILSGEAGHSVAEEITRGNRSVLEKAPGVKIVVQQSHPGWSTAAALATVENALTRYQNKIDAVLANNDGMALGAVNALSEQKLTGKVFVAGADADLTAVQNIVHGRQTMTVLKGIKPLAEAAANAAIRMALKQPVETTEKMQNGAGEVPVLNTPVEAVTRENLREVIVRSGFHTEKAVFGTGQG
ncbi:substrate-binding domain-containing protein [bacterium]|nr:substrate-binding domain-containing protein [bacterium]